MNVKPRWWAAVSGLSESACYFGISMGTAGVGWMLQRAGYVPNVAQSAETVSGIRLILSMTFGVGVLALAFAAASAAIYLHSRRSQNNEGSPNP